MVLMAIFSKSILAGFPCPHTPVESSPEVEIIDEPVSSARDSGAESEGEMAATYIPLAA